MSFCASAALQQRESSDREALRGAGTLTVVRNSATSLRNTGGSQGGDWQHWLQSRVLAGHSKCRAKKRVGWKQTNEKLPRKSGAKLVWHQLGFRRVNTRCSYRPAHGGACREGQVGLSWAPFISAFPVSCKVDFAMISFSLLPGVMF